MFVSMDVLTGQSYDLGVDPYSKSHCVYSYRVSIYKYLPTSGQNHVNFFYIDIWYVRYINVFD